MLKSSPIHDVSRALARAAHRRQHASTQSLPFPHTNGAIEATRLKSNFTEQFLPFLFKLQARPLGDQIHEYVFEIAWLR